MISKRIYSAIIIVNIFLIYCNTLYGIEPINFIPQSEIEDSDRELMPSQSVININNMAYWMKKSSAGTTSFLW